MTNLLEYARAQQAAALAAEYRTEVRLRFFVTAARDDFPRLYIISKAGR
jgi:hypothetical protein